MSLRLAFVLLSMLLRPNVDQEPAPAVQRAFAVIQGTIKDQTGGVMIGVDVTLSGAGGARTTVTDSIGVYRFPDVAPGHYLIKVTVPGFRPVEATGDVTTRSPVSVDITLIAAMAAQVDVRAAPSVQAPSSLSSRVLTAEQIMALPSNPKMFWQQIGEMAGGSGKLAIYVDGFANKARLPPREVIESIRIDANPFAAEFQEPGQTRVEITTKPGAEQISGQAAFNATSPALNASNAFAHERSHQQYQRYTGYLSGPIVKAKAGFLAYAGVWNENDNAVVNANTLDPATLRPVNVNTVVQTPAQTRNFSIKGNSRIGSHNTAVLIFDRTNVSSDNLGVGDVTLPESAYNSTSVQQALQFSLASTGQRSLNQFQAEYNDGNTGAHALGTGPAVLVFGAFAGGASPVQSNIATQRQASLSDSLLLISGKHAIKFGGRVVALDVAETDLANFGGTFSFGTDFERDANGLVIRDADGQGTPIAPLEAYQRTLQGLKGYAPLQFSINQGDASVGLTDWQVSLFAEDDWQLSEVFTLSYGVRRSSQSQVAAGGAHLEPRAAFAWMPDNARKGTVRVGAGLFNSLVDADPLLHTTRFDGSHAEQIVVRAPTFFPTVPENIEGTRLTETRHVLAPDLRGSSLGMVGINYERSLPANAWVSAGYTRRQSAHLLRSRNISPIISDPIVQLESSGRSTNDAMDVRWQQNIGKVIFSATYTLAFSRSDTDDPTTQPADAANLITEFGRASDDIRHTIVGDLSFPVKGFQVSTYVIATSAPPLNITTGRDNNGDTEFTDRPALAVPGDPTAVQTPFGLLTPTPPPGTVVIPRNYGRQKGRFDLSLSISKTIVRGISLSIDCTNLLNTVNFTHYNGVLTSTTFNQAKSALPARRIEIGLSKSF